MVDYEEEIKKRTQMVYVPNWFSVDIKTGVSRTTDVNPFDDYLNWEKVGRRGG